MAISSHLGRLLFKNLRTAEQEQSGKVLVQGLIKAALPTPGNTKSAAPPYPSR